MSKNIIFNYVPPSDRIEQDLVEIWQEVFQIEPIGINDPFLDLGGDSLDAMQIANQISEKLQINLPLNILFESATIAEIAEIILLYYSQVAAEQEE